MLFERVRYILTDPVYGAYELQVDPDGWDSQERSNSRSNKNLGFTAKYGDNLTFFKDGATRIGQILRVQGVEAKVQLRRDERHPTTEEWIEGYTNDLDMYSIVQENRGISVELKETGLKTIINDLRKESFELDRETDINGNAIPALEYDQFYNPGRKVFLQSKASNSEEVDMLHLDTSISNPGFSSFLDFQPFSLNQNYTSDTNFQSSISTGYTFLSTNISESRLFYVNSGEEKNLKVEVNVSDFTHFWNFKNENARLRFFLRTVIKRENGSWTILGGQTALIEDYNVLYNNSLYPNGFPVNINQSYDITLPQGHGLIFYYQSELYLDGNPTETKIGEKGISIRVLEDSVFEPTTNDCISFENAVRRWLLIATGSDDVYQTTLGENSIIRNFSLMSGLQIRNFPRIDRTRVINPNSLDQVEPVIESTISVSLDDLLSCDTYEPFGFEISNDQFWIKPLQEFFSDEIGLVVGEATRPVRKVASQFLFSTISIGNSKAGDYEEQAGLYEYNTLAKYTTSLKSADNEFKKESKIRVDPIGIEWARRSNIQTKPDEDYRADKEVFGIHSKIQSISNGVTIHTARLWADDLELPPQVYDPESAYNLILSPANCLKRWGFYLNIGLQQYPNEYIVFTESNGYKNLVIKQIGEDAIVENQDFKNGDLGDALFKGETIGIKTAMTGLEGFEKRQSMNDLDFMKKKVQLNDTGEYGYVLDSKVVGKEVSLTLVKK